MTTQRTAMTIALLAMVGTACATPQAGPAVVAAEPAVAAAPVADAADAAAGVTKRAARARMPQVVEVVVTDHSFDLPETIPSGWTTFRLVNETSETHFGLIDLLPEGRTVQDSIEEIVPVFQAGMDLINEGDFAAAEAEFGRLPAWSSEIVYMGGPGLVAPGGTASTTVLLEPGTYVMECYIKTDGVFHTTHGMITGFTVTDEETGASEPDADVEVTLSVDDGITVDGGFRPGRQTIAVHFADQTVHGNFLGHDLHVARVDDDTDLAGLGTWINWITGMEVPAPVEFVGGTHDMPAGSTAYVDVTLTPGTYALVSEVDAPGSKGLLRLITVPPASVR